MLNWIKKRLKTRAEAREIKQREGNVWYPITASKFFGKEIVEWKTHWEFPRASREAALKKARELCKSTGLVDGPYYFKFNGNNKTMSGAGVNIC